MALRDFGPALAPMNAFLTITGVETLHVRMERHVENARKVAEFLSGRDEVAWVSYAGLKQSPYYKLAQKYLPKGAGAVFTFGVKGGYEAGVRLVENVRLFSHLANIGDTRSLILHPASTTHRQLTDEQRAAAGAGADVIRLSIGLETADDLIRDLEQALGAVTGGRSMRSRPALRHFCRSLLLARITQDPVSPDSRKILLLQSHAQNERAACGGSRGPVVRP